MAETGWLKKALAEAKAERQAVEAYRKDKAIRQSKTEITEPKTDQASSD